MSLLPILMAIRVRGRTTLAVVACATGLPEADARTRLVDAAAAGFVHGVDGDILLSAAGRAELATLLARESNDRAALATLYDEFLATDSRLKTCITAWQLAVAPPRAMAEARTAAQSPAAATLGELRAVAAEARAFVERLAAIVARLAPYAQRLGAAADALARGDTRFVASPRVDSLHQVWFELHEDLLVTLGRERAA